MSQAAENPRSEEVVHLPVKQLHKSPSQPRRRGETEPNEDMIASIRAKGVIQPIVVRVRKAGGWEIVYGHRRWDGSIAAERKTIPAIVRALTDDEVFELQLIENVHRQDMHPLDEADGFKRMVDRGKTAVEIAAKVGRPVTYVAQRLKLCELGKEARAALDKDEISLTVAVQIARIPVELQKEALGSIQRWWNASQTKKELEARFLLRLDQAPFDITDPKLIEKAGACTACPKRTGQQRELFPDASRPDLCVDRVCYRGKQDALWQVRKKEAAAGGTPVLEGKAAEKAMGWGGGYKRLDSEEWTGSGHVKVRTLFKGKDLPPVTLARSTTGEVAELVKEADVAKVLKRRPDTRSSQGAQDRQRREKDMIRAAAVDAAVLEALGKVGKLGAAGLTRLMTQALIARTWDESEQKIVRRLGLEKKSGRGTRGDLASYLKTLTKPADVTGLGFELALRTFAPSRYNTDPEWSQAMRAIGVKFDAIERRLTAEAKAKKKARGKKTKPAVKAAA